MDLIFKVKHRQFSILVKNEIVSVTLTLYNYFRHLQKYKQKMTLAQQRGFGSKLDTEILLTSDLLFC